MAAMDPSTPHNIGDVCFEKRLHYTFAFYDADGWFLPVFFFFLRVFCFATPFFLNSYETCVSCHVQATRS